MLRPGLFLYSSDLSLYSSDLSLYSSGLPLYNSDLPLYNSDLSLYNSDLSLYSSHLSLRRLGRGRLLAGLCVLPDLFLYNFSLTCLCIALTCR